MTDQDNLDHEAIMLRAKTAMIMIRDIRRRLDEKRRQGESFYYGKDPEWININEDDPFTPSNN